MDIKSIVGRNYDMFGSLFGVRNSGSFIPVAADRGIPGDVSDKVKASYQHWGEGAHSPSWILWSEIQNTKWGEQGTALADTVYVYRKGESQWHMAFGWSSMLSREDYDILNRGESIERNGLIYKRQVLARQDGLSKDWETLFGVMASLNRYFEGDASENNVIDSHPQIVPHQDNCRVRLVVWFDN